MHATAFTFQSGESNLGESRSMDYVPCCRNNRVISSRCCAGNFPSAWHAGSIARSRLFGQ